MIFRHLNLYRLSKPVDVIQLNKSLEKNPFEACLPFEERSAGFNNVAGLDKCVFSSGDVHLFCLTIQEKSVPASALKAEYQKSLKIHEQSTGKLGRDEKNSLKDQIRESMLPRAFSKNNEIWAYIDNKNKILAINTTSRKNADGLANTIKNLVKGIAIDPITAQHDVSSRMTFWLSENQSPKPFISGFKCIISDGEGSIHYKKRSLEDSNLREYVKDDLKVTEMEFSYKDRLSFTLVEDFMIKDMFLTEVAMKDLGDHGSKPLDRLGGEIQLMANEVGCFLGDLLAVLGGESSHGAN